MRLAPAARRAFFEKKARRKSNAESYLLTDTFFSLPHLTLGNTVAFFEKKAPQKSKTGSYLRADTFFSLPRSRTRLARRNPSAKLRPV